MSPFTAVLLDLLRNDPEVREILRKAIRDDPTEPVPGEVRPA